jgi:uncharacterized protein
MAVCPICRKPVGPLGENPSFPFCSKQCRLIDLGEWLDERYRVPVEDGEAAEENEPPPRTGDETPG